jgi:hypothetical protein
MRTAECGQRNFNQCRKRKRSNLTEPIKSHRGQGGLSNAPPSANAFTPSASPLGNFTELKGEAVIRNSLSISLDPGLIAKEIRSQLDAGGNLRADTGVSMPRLALPR